MRPFFVALTLALVMGCRATERGSSAARSSTEHEPTLEHETNSALERADESGAPAPRAVAPAADACAHECREYGRCRWLDGACHVSSDDDCAKSFACTVRGECYLGVVDGRTACETHREDRATAAPDYAPPPPSRPARRYTPPSDGPVCQKGCRCGNACISCSKRCRQ